jgi:4-hydroxybenzoate polyprenyltransferase
MTPSPPHPGDPIDPSPGTSADVRQRPLALSLLHLARPKQWAKCAFVFIGPLYAMVDGTQPDWTAVVATAVAFAFASSFCYVINDYRDRVADRAHPRKRKRPIASGAVSPKAAGVFAVFLALGAVAPVFVAEGSARTWVGAAVAAYVANVILYSLIFKSHVILDVISLSLGFVLRVLGGCAATGVMPSAWLLNCTFFLAMFLAFGKRLGERRTMVAAGADVSTARAVQSIYTDELLRMVVVVTSVATLITYAGYVQTREARMPGELNFLWLTMLPATYGVFRSMVLLEQGAYDDPTELAAGDRPFQLAALLFGAITFAVFAYAHPPA